MPLDYFWKAKKSLLDLLYCSVQKLSELSYVTHTLFFLMALQKDPLHLVIPAQKTPCFSFPSHIITWKSYPSRIEKQLLPEDAKLFLQLHESVAKRLKNNVKEGKRLLETYPNSPEILNLVTAIYLANGKRKKGESLVKHNYQVNRDNLFAKINYADLCLRKKKIEQIPIIFEGKENLRDLYPHRSMFHVSEFRGFVVVMGLYFLEKKQRDLSTCYHYLAHRVDPKHPSTRILERKLYPSPSFFSHWKRIFPFKVDKNLSH